MCKSLHFNLPQDLLVQQKPGGKAILEVTLQFQHLSNRGLLPKLGDQSEVLGTEALGKLFHQPGNLSVGIPILWLCGSDGFCRIEPAAK